MGVQDAPAVFSAQQNDWPQAPHLPSSSCHRTGTRPFSYTAVFVSRTPNPTATWARVRLDSSGRNVPNSARRGDATFR